MSFLGRLEIGFEAAKSFNDTYLHNHNLHNSHLQHLSRMRWVLLCNPISLEVSGSHRFCYTKISRKSQRLHTSKQPTF